VGAAPAPVAFGALFRPGTAAYPAAATRPR